VNGAPDATSPTLPRVTVVMPVRNEADAIVPALRAVLDQRYPAELLEVLVVDGCSDDGTPAVVEREAARHRALGPSPCVRVLTNPGRIVPSAMNVGTREATGTFIVRVDGHCEVQPDHVALCVEALLDTGADNVGGLQVAEGKGPLAGSIAAAVSSPFGVGNSRFHYATEPGWVDTVYLGAYPKAVLEAVGGYDEELVRNQDDELNLRLRQRGGRIWLDPRIRTRYENRASFRSLSRQYRQYGTFKVRVAQKRATVVSGRSLVPAAWVLGTSAGILAALARRRFAPAALVVVPYVVANAAAATVTARRADGDARPHLVAAAFATCHASYGVGTLIGLWRWRHRWAEARGAVPLPPLERRPVRADAAPNPTDPEAQP
jgi:succinoglycan biosynthesis protein ExoA